MVASAYDFELDGFYYNVISVSDLTLELTTDVEIRDELNDGDNNKKYSGDVVIPETVNYKGKDWKIIKISYTFKFCYDVTSVTIPSSVSEIGRCSFIGCSSLKYINLSGGIKTIGMWAFMRCGFEKLNIPNNITYVDQCAFAECNSLKEVIIEEGDEPVYFKGGNWSFGVFADCSALEKTEINREYTFYDFRNEIVTPPFRRCLSLKTAIFGDKVTSVPKFSFEGCTSLTDVEMSNNILSIEQSAFSGCISLETLNLPSSVTTIADNVFKNCTSLNSTLIRNGMTSIGASAFEGCTSINSVDIVKTINNIGANAFNGCTNIKDIYVHNNVPISSVEESSFSGSSYLDAILHVPTGYIETYNNAPVWKLFFNIQEKKYGYNLIYIVDGEEYKKYDIEEGESITPEAEPIKEGYTFSGWSEIPEIMPAHDVTVTGTFNINKYKLTYTVDGEEYKTYEVEYGATITPEADPMKEGYTFSGWGEIPEMMPAHDIMVTGTFSINKYKLTYIVDGAEYKTYDVEYGATITPEAEPTKEGHAFSGWSEIPQTMPAHDVTVAGSFSINKYTLTYTVDGEKYKSYEVEYGTTITPEAAPTKEGYTFSGWSEIPQTMPAHDVTVTGTFNANSYKLTYMIDDKVYKETMYEYGATIMPEPQPEGDYQTFEWTDLPQTMPAHDVVVYASYTSGIVEVLMASQHNVRIYSPNGKKLNKLQKGLNIIILDDGTVKKVIMK